MSYKKSQRFTESSDELDFTVEHQPEGSLPLEAIAYEAGKAAFRAGVKREDNPEEDPVLREHWSNGWGIESTFDPA